MEQIANRSLTEGEKEFLRSLSRGDLIWAKIHYKSGHLAKLGPYIVTKSSSGCLKVKELDLDYYSENECGTLLDWLQEKIAGQSRYLEKM